MTNLVQARSTLRRAKGGRRRSTTRDGDRFLLQGGLNLVAPEGFVDPGNAAEGTVNYELHVGGGYERIAGAAHTSTIAGTGKVNGVHVSANGQLFAARRNGATTEKLHGYNFGTGLWQELTMLPVLKIEEVTEKGIEVLGGLNAGSFFLEGVTSGAQANIRLVSMHHDANGDTMASVSVQSVTGTFQGGEDVRGMSPAPTEVYGQAGSFDASPTISSSAASSWSWAPIRLGRRQAATAAVNGVDDRIFAIDRDGKVSALYWRAEETSSARPNLVAEFRGHLFVGVSFQGDALASSVSHSGLDRPFNFTAEAGANEIMLSHGRVTGLLPAIDTLFIFTRATTHTITGTSIADFVFRPFSIAHGAREHSVQPIGFGIHLTERGFSSLISTDRFGNFESQSFSAPIQPLIDQLLAPSNPVVASVVNSRKSLYRCFFQNGRVISITVRGEQVLGHMLLDYGTFDVSCASSGKIGESYRVYYGTAAGDVLRADVGTSIVGGPIEATLVLPPHSTRGPERVKRYRRCRIERSAGEATVSVTPTITLTDGERVTLGALTLSGDSWPAFRVDKEAVDVSLEIEHSEISEGSFILQAVHYQTAPRGAIDRETGVG